MFILSNLTWPFFIGLIVFSIITISLFYSALKPAKTLPIYNPADVNPELVDSTVQYISKYHTIADFSFINQNGKTITQKDYEGKIYVADFFFTTCGWMMWNWMVSALATGADLVLFEGSINRQNFAASVLNEWYLFPETLPSALDSAAYTSVQAYINALTAKARGQGRDRYLTYVTSFHEVNAYYAYCAKSGF